MNARRGEEGRGTGAIVLATAFAAVAVLAFQAVASRALGPDRFSPVALLWTEMFLLHTVLLLPAEQHFTRALVVTRTTGQIARIRRDMILAASVALAVGVGFTAITLNRFFGGVMSYVLLIALIVVTRSTMVAGRGFLAGNRRFVAYGASIALESLALLLGAVAVAAAGGGAVAFSVVMAVAPLATLATRPFSSSTVPADHHLGDAQAGSFLIWLVVATAASQLIIAGGPIAVGFVGGEAAAVSVFFTSFALLRGPVTSAYNLVARVLPDFTEIAHGPDPDRIWQWAFRIAVGGLGLAGVAAAGAGVLLRPIVAAVYGADFEPPLAMAILGGAGVGLGLGALFATQVYSAAARGAYLALGWIVSLSASLIVLIAADMAPVNRVALAFVAGEGTGLVLLGLVIPRFMPKVEIEGPSSTATPG